MRYNHGYTSVLSGILLLTILRTIYSGAGITEDVKHGEASTTASENVLGSFESSNKFILFMEREGKYELNFSIPCEQRDNMIIEFSSNHSSVFEVTGSSSLKQKCLPDFNKTGYYEESRPNISNQMLFINGSVPVTMKGNTLGVAGLIVTVRSAAASSRMVNGQNSADCSSVEYIHPVSVQRYLRLIDKIFIVAVSVFIVIALISFGCNLDIEVVKECVKRPLAPGIGFVCQHFVMPLLSFTIAKLIPTGDQGVSFGIFLCGICPDIGGCTSYTCLLDGDISLSITMTFVSTVVSIGMMPFWIYTLGRVFTKDQSELTIPYLDILQITAMVVGALLIGVFLKIKFHKVAMVFAKTLKRATLICALCIVIVGIHSNVYLFRMFRPIHFFIGCLIPCLGGVLSGVVAALFRIPWVKVKTIAIETGQQNLGVAYILLMKSFSPPYGDIAALAPAALRLMTPISLLVITTIYVIHKRCTRRNLHVEQTTDTCIGSKKAIIGMDIVDTENGLLLVW